MNNNTWFWIQFWVCVRLGILALLALPWLALASFFVGKYYAFGNCLGKRRAEQLNREGKL